MTTEMISYALVSILALVTVLSLILVIRSTRKSVMGVEERISNLEKDLDLARRELVEQFSKTSEEMNLKDTQAKREIRAALDASLQSVMKKVAEADSVHKARLDSLASQIASLREAPPRTAASVQRELVSPAKSQPAPAGDVSVKAQRLARLIVSEIALYNRKKVEEGAKNGTFHDILEYEIREARSLYAKRVPEEVRNKTSYLDEAFTELIEKTKKDLSR